MKALLKSKGLFNFVIVIMTIMGIMNSALAQGSNWPQWRGPGGRGVSDETNLPYIWSESKNIAWKTEISGRGHSSPVVWGKKIFLTTSIEGPVVPGTQAIRHIYKGDDPRFKNQEYHHPEQHGIGPQLYIEGVVHRCRHRQSFVGSNGVSGDGLRQSP